MRGFLADCRHALRLYARTPGASLLAVAGFAVAMAAVASLVSMYVDLLFRPHAGFEQSHRLVTFGWSDGETSAGLDRQLIDRIAEEVTTLEAAAAAAATSFQAGPEREAVLGEMVTREFFSGVGARLALGRGFEPGEHQSDGAPVIVISHAYWQERFDGRSDVLGTTMTLASRRAGIEIPGRRPPQEPTEFQIVGVMHEGLPGTYRQDYPTTLWIPVERALALLGDDINVENAVMSMRGLGRRSAGASAKAVASELQQRYSDDMGLRTVGLNARYEVLDGLVFDAVVQRDTQRQLQMFLAVSVLLAIVAAANISLFLLARAPGRQRELGIRMSVGAPHRRLARQLVCEAGLLVVASAVLGLGLSIWFSRFLSGLSFLQAAQWRDIALLDWRVLTTLAAIVLALTVLVSLAPMLGLKRLGIAGSSRRMSARPSVTQRIAGAAQIAVAGSLAGAAVAFGWYLAVLTLAWPGYETSNMHVASYQVPIRIELGTLVGNTLADRERRRDAILSIPGIDAVSFAGFVPGRTTAWSQAPHPHPQDPDRQIRITQTFIDSHYVDVLGLRLLHGNSPAESDARAALVNRALAEAFWGRDNVVGEFVPTRRNDEVLTEIVGVLDDLSYEHPEAVVEPIAFMTGANNSGGGLIIIKSAMSSAEVQLALQALLDAGDLEMQIENVTTLQALRGETTATDRARSALIFGAALLVVVLATVGFYGTQRYLVTAGRREFAIRASLGAGPGAIGRLVIRRGLLLGLPGLVLGVLLAFISVAWLRDEYLSRSTSPIAVTVGVGVGLIALLVVASLGPARQARCSQPAPLLRED